MVNPTLLPMAKLASSWNAIGSIAIFCSLGSVAVPALPGATKTVLMLSLAIVGLFTINVYTDGKYMENLAFLGGFILIIILAYYLIYSNSVVRTRSNNVYWGKENKNNYSDI